jgi:hypothetical protein
MGKSDRLAEMGDLGSSRLYHRLGRILVVSEGPEGVC